MRRSWVPLLSICVGVAAIPAAEVPRPAPELSFTLPSGQQVNVDSYKGKVVALEFLSTTCTHCQRTAATIEKLYRELGNRGLQPLGVAIDPEASERVSTFSSDLKLTYPVGTLDRRVAGVDLQRATPRPLGCAAC